MEKIIVLLHGFGEDHKVFNKQIEALSEKYRVFAPDLPGSGLLKDYQWQIGSETIEWLAEWVNEQLVLNKIETCIMLGHSMGGYITLAFAEKFPEKLLAFGLVHSTSFADTEPKKENRIKAIEFIKEKGAFLFLKTAIPGLFGSQFANNHPEIIAALVEKARSFTPVSLSAYYSAILNRPNRSSILKKTSLPVLIIAGTDDMAVPFSDLLKQASIPSICHFHILHQVGHMGMLEDSLKVSSILSNFIEVV